MKLAKCLFSYFAIAFSASIAAATNPFQDEFNAMRKYMQMLNGNIDNNILGDCDSFWSCATKVAINSVDPIVSQSKMALKKHVNKLGIAEAKSLVVGTNTCKSNTRKCRTWPPYINYNSKDHTYMLYGMIITQEEKTFWKVLKTDTQRLDWVEGGLNTIDNGEAVLITAVYLKVVRNGSKSQPSGYLTCAAAKVLLTKDQRALLQKSAEAIKNLNIEQLKDDEIIQSGSKQFVAEQIWNVIKEAVFSKDSYLLYLADLVFGSIDWNEINLPCLANIINQLMESTYQWIPSMIIGYMTGLDSENSSYLVMAVMYMIGFFTQNILENTGAKKVTRETINSICDSLQQQLLP